MVASSLQMVMTQQLMKRKSGGRIGAFEVMVCVPAIRNLIRARIKSRKLPPLCRPARNMAR